MPCWYYDKKELKNTPSALDNIDPEVEARYRREGARFIIDAGTKMGLRHDTCATGVVYFHRFYMFHSFQEFHRFATGACCLFLAGKVEETPKKCKDIIKTCQTLLTPQQLAAFGEDPKEEVMTLERILLQTIKFDLQIDHPYRLLLKYAKILKGDKAKIQKMVQMAWTFVNDSMCTMLSLQWEPEIISVSLMYLASRLSKTDIQDWHGKLPGAKIKWYEHFVEGISMELMEDVCHQVLDLYSKLAAQKKSDSPPPPSRESVSSSSGAGKRRGAQASPSATRGKVARTDSMDVVPPPPESASRRPVQPAEAVAVVTTQPPPAQPYLTSITDSNFTQYNPYVSSQMYSSSFMSQEGNQSIQNLLNPGEVPPAYAGYPPTSTQYANPPSAGYQQPPYAHPQAYAAAPPQGYQAPPPAMAYPPGAYPPATTAYQPVMPGAQYPEGYQIEPNAVPAPGYPGAPGFNPQQQPPPTFPGPTDTQMVRPPGTGLLTLPKGVQPKVKPNKSTGLATVRISSRQVRR